MLAQNDVRYYEEVSDECSRRPQAIAWCHVCSLYMQKIAKLQHQRADPFTNAARRRWLQEQVQHYENEIKPYKPHISSYDACIKQIQAAMAALQGEPLCFAKWLLMHPDLADGHAHCYANHVAMVTCALCLECAAWP